MSLSASVYLSLLRSLALYVSVSVCLCLFLSASLSRALSLSLSLSLSLLLSLSLALSRYCGGVVQRGARVREGARALARREEVPA